MIDEVQGTSGPEITEYGVHTMCHVRAWSRRGVYDTAILSDCLIVPQVVC